MLRIVAIMCVLSTAVALAAPAPLPKRGRLDVAAAELQKMQGEWIVTEREGKKEASNLRAVVSGNRFEYLLDGQVRTKWVLTLDVTKNPKILDRKRTFLIGSPHGDGMLMHGIYKIEGDTWTITESLKVKRPTDFEGMNAGEWLSVMRRAR